MIRNLHLVENDITVQNRMLEENNYKLMDFDTYFLPANLCKFSFLIESSTSVFFLFFIHHPSSEILLSKVTLFKKGKIESKSYLKSDDYP